jgi:hypothetical protein
MLPALAGDRARCDYFARRSAFAILLDGVRSGREPMSRFQRAAATVRPKKQRHHDGGNDPEECCLFICGIEHTANLAPDAGGSQSLALMLLTFSARALPRGEPCALTHEHLGSVSWTHGEIGNGHQQRLRFPQPALPRY